MTSQNYLVEVEGLSAGYNKTPVFNDLNFGIGCNEVFGLIGLNGIGKTTLIKTILGLREPMSGKILINKEDKKNKRETISYLPERFDPPWFLSGYEFIEFSLKLYNKKIEEQEIIDLADKVLLKKEFLKKKVQSYSKGMRQKLGLMATVLTGCPLLILDEPMSGLDPKARYEVKRLICKARDNGQSVFMSSHILSDMAELCDRVAVLHDGQLKFQGSPDDMSKKGKGKSLEESFLNIISD